jgi:ubiquinone/menaquinone biosynthesis C-methylase UbiE
MTNKKFWAERAKHYNELKWVQDDEYLDKIVDMCNPQSTDLVLDVGTGSGKVAKALKPHIKHVIGLDISEEMMQYEEWEGMSKICCDILNPLLVNNKFNLITARMVFHHVSNVEKGIKNCYNLLKSGGRLIIAESVPPSDEEIVEKWWTEVRRFKEERHVFSLFDLQRYLIEAKFNNIQFDYYYQSSEKSSTKEWLEKSKLSKSLQKTIYDLHINAPKEVKIAHKMIVTDSDILCEHRHLIIRGIKSGRK